MINIESGDIKEIDRIYENVECRLSTVFNRCLLNTKLIGEIFMYF